MSSVSHGRESSGGQASLWKAAQILYNLVFA
jgi:hypothetical protein